MPAKRGMTNESPTYSTQNVYARQAGLRAGDPRRRGPHPGQRFQHQFVPTSHAASLIPGGKTLILTSWCIYYGEGAGRVGGPQAIARMLAWLGQAGKREGTQLHHAGGPQHRPDDESPLRGIREPDSGYQTTFTKRPESSMPR